LYGWGTMKNQRKRPLGVTLFALMFLWIGCIGSIAFPLMAASGGLNAWEQAAATFIHSDLWLHFVSFAATFILLCCYVLYAVLGYGLWRLRNWARRGVQALFLFSIFVSLIVVAIWIRPLSFAVALLLGMVAPLALQFWYFTRPNVRFAFGAPMTLAEQTPIAGPPPKPSRHVWGWVVTGVVFFALFAGSLFLGIEVMFRNSDVYKMALSEARSCPATADAIGTAVTSGWDAEGNLEESTLEGRANLSIPVRGSRGSGDLALDAVKKDGSWKITSLALEHGDVSDPIITGGISNCVQH